jgi:Protein of unknown function (DUF3592)
MRFFTIAFGVFFPLAFTMINYLLHPDPFLGWFVDPDQLKITSGTITSSSVKVEGSASKNAIGWNFVILYEYEVAGITYTSSRVHYGYTGSSNRDYAEYYVKQYPEGKHVMVYYDPFNPEESSLDPYSREYEIFYAFLGSLLFGIFVMWIGFNIK